MSTTTTFYARHHGKIVGPVSFDELNELTRRGIIPMKAEVWEAPISPALCEPREPTRLWLAMEKMAGEIRIGFFRAIGAAPILAVVFSLVLVVLYWVLERVWAERIHDLIEAMRKQ